MKAWKGLLIVGALLLLVNVPLASTSSTTSSPKAKHRTLAQSLVNASHINTTTQPKPSPSTPKLKMSGMVLRSSKELLKTNKYLKKRSLKCSEDNDCKHGAKECRNGFCWCNDNSIQVKVGTRDHDCIDLDHPCSHAKKLKLCHQNASCIPQERLGIFTCDCNEGFKGDGDSCRQLARKTTAKPTRKTTTTAKPKTKTTVKKRKTADADLTFTDKIIKKVQSKVMDVYHMLSRYIYPISAGAAFLVVLLIVLACLCRRQKRKKLEKQIELMNNMDSYNEGYDHAGYDQMQHTGHAPKEMYYETPMDEFLGPLPPAPPPPPPPPGHAAPATPPTPPTPPPFQNPGYAVPEAPLPPPPPPPPPPPSPLPATSRPGVNTSMGKGKKGTKKTKEGGRKASANRKAIQDALGGKPKSFAEEMSTAQSIISSGPEIHVVPSQSSFYSDDEAY